VRVEKVVGEVWKSTRESIDRGTFFTARGWGPRKKEWHLLVRGNGEPKRGRKGMG